MSSASSIKSRIAGGAAALAAVRLIQIAGPLIQLPIFIWAWGASAYGGWITATAVATLCTLVSLSIYPAMQASMAVNIGRGDLGLASRYYSAGKVICWLGSAIFCLLAILLYWWLGESGTYSIPDVDITTVSLLFFALTGNGISAYYCSALGAVGHYGRGNAIDAFRRAVELLLTLAMVGLFRSEPTHVAMALCVSSVVGIIISARAMRIAPEGFALNAPFERALVWESRRPILGAFLLGYAYPQLFVTGPRIIIGIFLGNTAVVLFSTAANLVRIPRQVADILSYPFLNDMSYAFGEQNFERLRSIFLLPSQLCLIMSVCAGIMLTILGPFMVEVLIGQTHPNLRLLIALLSISSVLDCTVLVAMTFLLAIGRTAKSSFLLMCAGSVALALAIPLTDRIGLLAFGVANLIGVVIYSGALWRDALAIMGYSKRDFMKALLAPDLRSMVTMAIGIVLRKNRSA